jgi:hypothetical protein
LDAVKAKDRDLGYQVGMLLDEIARMASAPSPSEPPEEAEIRAILDRLGRNAPSLLESVRWLALDFEKRGDLLEVALRKLRTSAAPSLEREARIRTEVRRVIANNGWGDKHAVVLANEVLYILDSVPSNNKA